MMEYRGLGKGGHVLGGKRTLKDTRGEGEDNFIKRSLARPNILPEDKRTRTQA